MDRTTRRAFLGSAAAGTVALVGLRDPFAFGQAGVPVARGGTFRQGVASGQQSTSGITLWSKVDGLDGTGRVQFEVSPDRDFSRVIHRADAVAAPANGGVVLQRVEGLRPGEQYFYRCFTCDVDSSVGRFRTARPADSAEPVRIGFFSCQDWEAGYYTAHTGLANEDLDLVVCLGDYIYEKSFYEGPRTDPVGEAETLAQYRDKYGLYHGDAALRRVREQFALMAIWDDHEVEDNYAELRPGNAVDRRDLPFPERRANAYQAFFEHMPRIRVPGDPDRIYGSIPLGGTAEVILLDTRQYRSDQPSDPDDGEFRNPEVPVPTNAPLYDPALTLLGQEQLSFVRSRLTGSPATWKVVGNQIMVMAIDAPPGYPINPDQWDGYGAERGRLLEGITPADNVTFVTGDIHTFFAGVVTQSGRALQSPFGDGGFADTPVATEYVGGSITSRGFGDQAPDGTSPFGPTAAARTFEAAVLAGNGHLRYMEGERRGYGVLEATREQLRVTFRAPRTAQEPTSDVFTIAEFVQPAGTAEVTITSQVSGTAQPVPLP